MPRKNPSILYGAFFQPHFNNSLIYFLVPDFLPYIELKLCMLSELLLVSKEGIISVDSFGIIIGIIKAKYIPDEILVLK